MHIGGVGRFLGVGLLLFASFSASTNYKLNSYSVGPGATNSSSSTYKLQGSLGEQTNGSATGTTYTAKNGSVQTYQLNTPSALTLGNGSNTYYNRLSFIVNTANEPSDATYAIIVSTSSTFSSPSYVQADGTLNSSQVYQSYAAWGGSSGTLMTGLAPSTTYYAAEIAMEGLYTNTARGASANIATVAPTISFSVSPNSISMGNLLSGSVVTSSNLSLSFATNAVSGGSVYVSGQNNGLKSATQNYTVSAYSGNLAGAVAQGFGLQATNPSQSSGGPLSAVAPFNGSSNTVGAESATPQQMLTTTNPIVGGSANANMQAKISTTTPAAADYQEVLSFVASAGF